MTNELKILNTIFDFVCQEANLKPHHKLNRMTENELKGLGFELTQQYEHDQYHTNRYAKGVLEVEFSYEGDKLLTCDLTISELNCKPVTLDEMKALAPILGGWHE